MQGKSHLKTKTIVLKTKTIVNLYNRLTLFVPSNCHGECWNELPLYTHRQGDMTSCAGTRMLSTVGVQVMQGGGLVDNGDRFGVMDPYVTVVDLFCDTNLSHTSR